jgi:K+-sensing histidine kinase KdpD
MTNALNPQLAAIIVHDIKNALGALEGELAELSSQQDKALAANAHANCVRLREKLVGFLTLYKASEQGLTPRIESVNPKDFLHELVRNHVTDRTGVDIVIDSIDMPDVAFFDEHLVELALNAALHNATRFAQSRIELSCGKADHGVAFSIKDDGPGLGAKEHKPSTGLGMALSVAIADAHQNGMRRGEATLNNAAEGGALFILRLP